MPRNFTSPVGRLVQGTPFEAQLTDQQGRPRVVQSGPNMGQPSPQWYVGVAFLKTDPLWLALKAEINAESAEAWPHLFPQGPAGPCILATFSNKIVDGDGVDTTGALNSGKEGFAGHDVVRFTTGYAPKVYRPVNGAHVEETNAAALKRGDYVRVSGNMTTNGNATKPGIYVNFNMLEIVGYGQAITSGPTPGQAFATPAVLPAGASSTPVAQGPAPTAAPATPPARVMLPAANGATYEAMIAAGWTDATLVQHGMMQAVAAAPATPPAPVAPTPPVATAPPPPAYGGYVAAAAAPPPAPAAPAPTPPARVMLPAANGATYEAMIAAGWTDATLVQHGMMAA